jgi:hypothetical protein
MSAQQQPTNGSKPNLLATTTTTTTTSMIINLEQPESVQTKESLRNQPEDLDVTRNNEATNEFQAKTIEVRNQRPQWITYFQ